MRMRCEVRDGPVLASMTISGPLHWPCGDGRRRSVNGSAWPREDSPPPVVDAGDPGLRQAVAALDKARTLLEYPNSV